MVGKQLAHFEITDTLGEGGMGVVYGAFDRHLERRVAVKILPPGKVADPARKQRFIQEARAASALNHPNIVTIYDISEADGVDYIAMEFVPGQTLEDVLARRRLKLPEALKYAAQLAGALAAAHAAGLMHRDLKPANIMITDAGVAKVLDFGLAKLTEHEVSDEQATRSRRAITEAGTVVGTAVYMSPEQAEGRALDARSDIFSFGLVLYEMLSGKRAFSGATGMATMAAILEKEPVPIAQLVPGLPKELERIVARCLRKDLARRSQSIAEIELALQELKEESESGASVGTPASRRTPARRWPWLAVAGSLVLSVAVFVLYRQWRGADLPPSEFPLTSFPGYQGQPSLSPDGSQFAFVWDGGVTGDQQLYVSLVGRGAPLRLTNTAGTSVFSPAWSPDGLTIAFIRSRAGANTRELGLISPLGGPERKIAAVSSGGAAVSSGGLIAWSPDGKWLYFPDNVTPQTRALFAMSSDGGEKRRLTEPLAGSFGDGWPSVSPDSRHLAFVRNSADFNSDLFVADLTDALTVGAVRRLTLDRRSTASPVWTRDGRDIIYVSGETFGLLGIYRVRATGGSPTKLALSGGDYATTLSIASKGTRLVYSRARQDFNMYQRELPPDDGPAGPPIKFLSSTRLEQSPTYSPSDGRRILFSSNRTGAHQMFVADVDGSNLVQLTHMPGWAAGSPKWSPDATTIVFDARPTGLSDIYSVSATGGPSTQLTNHPAEDHVPCYSSDGQWIYFTSARGGLRQLFRMPAPGGDAEQFTRKGGATCQASPDGKWIYYSKQGGGLWKMPPDGGEEIAVLDPRAMLGSSAFTVTSSRIYYGGPRDPISGTWPLTVHRLTDGKRVELGRFDKPLRLHFSVSPDGRWLAWTQVDSSVNDQMLVENFR